MENVKFISVLNFEEKVLEIEGIVIRVRASSGTEVLDYAYTRMSKDSQTVSSYLHSRIVPCLGELEFSIIGGNFSSVMGQTSLKALRESYVRKQTTLCP